jgi:hypothetical protein
VDGSVEGTCPTIRPMSEETCSILIAAMDEKETCVDEGQCTERPWFVFVERESKLQVRRDLGSSCSAFRCKFPFRVTFP